MEWRDAQEVQNAFSLAHPEFYEPLSYRPLTSEYLDRLRALLPAAWAISRDGLWLHAGCPGAPDARARPQGFKVHVSSVPGCALEALDLVAPVCVAEKVDFKIAADPSLLSYLNAKQQHRGSSGKFMTIYPPDDEAFKALMERLHQETRSSSACGPYILSDRRYKDSRLLFYRYGSFRPLSLLNSDGTRTDYLVSPDGDLEPDLRPPFSACLPGSPIPSTAGPSPRRRPRGCCTTDFRSMAPSATVIPAASISVSMSAAAAKS